MPKGKSLYTAAFGVNGRWMVATLCHDGTLAVADTAIRLPLSAVRDCPWVTVAAVTSAARVRGTASDPNAVPFVSHGIALPLVVDPDAGQAFVVGYAEDGTLGTPRSGIPHAAGVGLVSLIENHPNGRVLPAEVKAWFISMVSEH